MTWDILRFLLWRRSSEYACFVVIHVANYLSKSDLRQMRDYLKSLEVNRPTDEWTHWQAP